MLAKDEYIKLQDVWVQGINSSLRSESLKQNIASLFKRKESSDYKIQILKSINFSAKENECIGLIGKNGSGKSSLLKVIAGIYPSQKGKVETKGNIAPLIERGLGLNAELTGRQNIKLGLVYSGRLKDYSKELEEEIIEFSELGEKIDVPLKYYSSGMRARLTFCISIFQNPDILLLDEVFATGDKAFVEKSRELMKKKAKDVPVTIFASHSAKAVRTICNRCIYLKDGSIVASGSVDEILEMYEDEK